MFEQLKSQEKVKVLKPFSQAADEREADGGVQMISKPVSMGLPLRMQPQE